jgi:Fis family transcriptional regulator, factor for inversion stimulation protein
MGRGGTARGIVRRATCGGSGMRSQRIVDASNLVHDARAATDSVPLRAHAERALTHYFAALEGARPSHLYDLVISQVEEPLLKVVLDYADGNQSRAAGILGIHRATLRKKLRQHGLSS